VRVSPHVSWTVLETKGLIEIIVGKARFTIAIVVASETRRLTEHTDSSCVTVVSSWTCNQTTSNQQIRVYTFKTSA